MVGLNLHFGSLIQCFKNSMGNTFEKPFIALSFIQHLFGSRYRHPQFTPTRPITITFFSIKIISNTAQFCQFTITKFSNFPQQFPSSNYLANCWGRCYRRRCGGRRPRRFVRGRRGRCIRQVPRYRATCSQTPRGTPLRTFLQLSS